MITLERLFLARRLIVDFITLNLLVPFSSLLCVAPRIVLTSIHSQNQKLDQLPSIHPPFTLNHSQPRVTLGHYR